MRVVHRLHCTIFRWGHMTNQRGLVLSRQDLDQIIQALEAAGMLREYTVQDVVLYEDMDEWRTGPRFVKGAMAGWITRASVSVFKEGTARAVQVVEVLFSHGSLNNYVQDEVREGLKQYGSIHQIDVVGLMTAGTWLEYYHLDNLVSQVAQGNSAP